MSHVYAATDTVLQRPVAVKILTEDGCRDQDAKRRFLLEAQMCGNIAHDNIIRVHDYGEQSGRPYIVMELLAGEDLRSAIEKNHLGDLASKLRIAQQAARALKHIHGLNIIHRDIKPDNLHIDQSGRVRLMDFGIAKTKDLSLTRTGFAVGTPFYMAPEQVMGKTLTPSADIYAFGIVLYEMLTGVKPLTGETVESLFYLILQQPLDLGPMQKAGVPQALIDLVQRMTAKKPEDRPASFEQVTGEIERLLMQVDPSWVRTTTGPIPAPLVPQPPAPATPPTTRPAWLPIAGGIAGVALLAAVGIYFSKQPEQKTNPVVQPKKEIPKPSPVVRDAYGEMLLVPGGKFLSGSNNAERELPDFYIDKTEVPVGQWNKFSREMSRPERQGVAEDLPVSDVTFDEAAAFCGWAHKRLPTGDEWEKAARGPSGRKYPWGNMDDPARANVKGNPTLQSDHPLPVDSMSEGASEYGIVQIAGNVWEWVRQDGHPSEQARAAIAEQMRRGKFAPLTPEDVWFVVRGGGFDFGLEGAVLWEAAPMPGRFKSQTIGFRCVRDVQ